MTTNKKPNAMREQASERSGQFSEATYYLADWFLGAASTSLREAGAETELSSGKIMHRVSAVFFAAAAFESHLNRMADELVDGSSGLPVMDLDGVLRSTFKGLAHLRWTQKLPLYTFLSAAGNRWALKSDLPALKLVTELMVLRNRLIHAPPEKTDLEGDRESAKIHIHNKRIVVFGRGPAPDLPEELLQRLTIKKVTAYIGAVDEMIRRLKSLGDLWPEGKAASGSRAAVQALGDDGSRAWIDLDSGKGHQVRWCTVTRRYVMHTFTAPDPMLRGNSPVAPDEASRACCAIETCSRVEECPWEPIRERSKQA